MSGPLMQTVSLNAYYGDFQALNNVSLYVDHGETIAIVGANGAGKSTLLRSIAGLIKTNADSVQFNGVSIGDWRPDKIAKAGVALIPEGRQLFPSLSVEENLKLGSTVRRAGHWQLESIYQLFPVLKERCKQASTSLSGGQQQMVAIGRALMSNPEVLLFDEVSLGLAPVIINDIYEQLPNIVSQGTSAVIIEQDVGRAMAAASRLYCLQDGQVKLAGNANELKREQITEAYFGTAV